VGANICGPQTTWGYMVDKKNGTVVQWRNDAPPSCEGRLRENSGLQNQLYLDELRTLAYVCHVIPRWVGVGVGGRWKSERSNKAQG